MLAIRFPAQLEDENGSFIEQGYCELAPFPNSVNFLAGFIPLYPIGTKVTVVRLFHGKRRDVLRGEVFLSSRSLIRVTGIDADAIAHVQRLFGSNTKFTARPYISADRKFLAGRSGKIEFQTEATVYYLSDTEIKLLTMDPLTAGQVLTVDLEEPFLLKDMKIEVESVVDFDNIMNAYLCRIVELPEPYQDSLRQYLASLAEEAAL